MRFQRDRHVIVVRKQLAIIGGQTLNADRLKAAKCV
jgi:hypothetical protein